MPAVISAVAIVDRMQTIVRARWRDALRLHGVTAADCDKVAAAFDYPGFELDPELVLGGV